MDSTATTTPTSGRRYVAVCCREWVVVEPTMWGLRKCGLCDTVPVVVRPA